jgi:CHAD domain-containing protein
MRVATRRLRAMLEVLTVVYDAQTVSRLRKALKRLAASLGAVRDADVWIHAIDTYTAERSPEERAGMMPLMQTLVARRDIGRRNLERELDAPRTRQLRESVEGFVSTPGAGVRSEGMATRVRDRAGSALWERFEAIRAFEPVMPVAPVETLHEVRIAGKHLRYTFELFDDALPDDARKLRAELVSMQEHLGALHDADLSIPFVDALLAEDSGNEVLRGYRASLEQTAHVERRRSEGSWEVLNNPTFGQRLAAVIAAL